MTRGAEVSRADALWRCYESALTGAGLCGRTTAQRVLEGDADLARYCAERCLAYEQYAALAWSLWSLEASGYLPDNPLADPRVRRCETRYEVACSKGGA